jgi:hypothetical protein
MAQKDEMTIKPKPNDMEFVPSIAPRRISAPYVRGSMEVEPKRIEIQTTPGSRPRMFSKTCPDFMNNKAVHAKGKMSPQLTFGGFNISA